MAHLIFRFKDREIGRIVLRGAMVIGRAPECDATVRDILLSRRHCRIELRNGQWIVTDLGSKNGTFIDQDGVYRRTAQHVLREGTVLRMGKTRITFHEGALDEPQALTPSPRSLRPRDPLAALSDTVVEFALPGRDSLRHLDRNFPVPRPAPLDPASYRYEGVQSMVHELVSSSWDSIYADASRRVRPERPPPRPLVSKPTGRTIATSRPAMAKTLSLVARVRTRARKIAVGFGLIAQLIVMLTFAAQSSRPARMTPSAPVSPDGVRDYRATRGLSSTPARSPRPSIPASGPAGDRNQSRGSARA